jgi:glycosyltransferase involved in cell wall biosynthesis
MGNNKKNKSKIINTITNKSVSIITITQYKRFECIKILLDLIKSQTYSNIIEWIIVEGSKLNEEAQENKKNILNFIEQTLSQTELKLKFKIIYVEKEKDVKLGELRNIGNKMCNGDITVCMDDDDYYPPDRVEHAVSKLSESTSNIAGCSAHLMYDYDFNILVQMKEFGPSHSINSCMAWKKEYLKTNSHDPEKEFGEEQSFTKNFTEPMVQLDPFSTVILSSHSSNTYSKKIFYLSFLNQYPNNIDKLINKPINKYVPNDIYSRYKTIFIPSNLDDEPKYDIVYMCGAFSIEWDPENRKLGGSEQAVVNLSENWVKMGKSVIVFGEVPPKLVNGVVYKHWTKFNFNRRYKNLILWRNFGMTTTIPLNVKADFMVVDVHDNFIGQGETIFRKYYTKCNKVFLKSNYHKECLLNKVDKNSDQNNIVIIPNGIRVNKFCIQPEDTQRNPYRFCYCSCYTRGLDKIIGILWPIIYNYEPRAELHVYYGMDLINDVKYKNHLRSLLGSPGVMDHGRQPIEIIIREKYLSTFQFYITNTEAEIDCISIRESLVTGCIPLLSNFGVFKERQGLHFDFNTEKEIKMTAISIINLLKNPEKVKEFREQIKNDSSIIDWETIAFEWNKYFIN